MERWRTLIVFVLCAASAMGQYTSFARNRVGATYYIAVGGNDANDGLTPGTAWLTPNHALNCGDTIMAQASTAYVAANFASGKWGTVTCASGNDVVWMTCATFDACRISATGTAFGMYVSASYWGISNWEVTVAATGFTAFAAAPPSSGATASIHHIVFANNIANGAGGGGFSSFSVSNFGVDYLSIVGNIAYNAAQNDLNCYSGISVFQPVATDSLTGTHIYVSGNFSFGNVDPSTCPNPPGGANTATDGEGGIFDTFDWKNVGAGPYTQKAVMDNNMFLSNGGYGMEVQSYTKNLVSYPTVLRRNNTVWGNNTSSARNTTSLCADSVVNIAYNVQDTGNIIQTTRTAGCPTANTIYAASKYDTTSASGSIDSGNWYYAASGAGTTTSTFNDDGGSFTFGSNNTGTSPAFASPAAPTLTQPSGCNLFSNVPACMGTVIANFVPSAVGTAGKGYQAVSTSNGSDQANYPQWLCKTGLPYGIITNSCN